VASEWDGQLRALGSFIRAQRKLANLSLRQMAALAKISNPYLSQIERGMNEPSVHVLRSIAQALDLSAETLLGHAGLLDPEEGDPSPASSEAAIRRDPLLTDEQKRALLAVYQSYRAANGANGGATRAAEADEGADQPNT
jgi:transcriptional regulator with XRE-family HTH domain